MKTMLSSTLSESGQGDLHYSLTPIVRVYTFTIDMGRPRITHDNRRSKLFPLRLSPRETAFFSRSARDLGESVASVLRNGGMLYIKMRGKDGSQKRKENKQGLVVNRISKAMCQSRSQPDQAPSSRYVIG